MITMDLQMAGRVFYTEGSVINGINHKKLVENDKHLVFITPK